MGEAQKEEAKAEETGTEETKTEKVESVEVKPEEAKTEESKAEESKPEEANKEESKAEESKTEEAKTEGSKPEEPKTEETTPEEPKTENKTYVRIKKVLAAYFLESHKWVWHCAIAAAVIGCAVYWFQCQPRFHDLTVELGTESINIEAFATEFANLKKAGIVTDRKSVV